MEPENQEKEIEMEQEPIKVYKGGGAVNSVNGKTGDVVLTTSDLENDSDYQTGSEVDSAIDSAIGELNIPTKTSDLENDGEDGSSVYIEADELAPVATSGSYNDLDNKPTIPAAQVNSDWNADSGVAQILNKPTIPTVNDATLTITQNGTSKGTFTANDADDTTIEVSDTTYTAGTGIDITNGVISATGGGGPTVVQTIGSSTTDVMSQNATSRMIYTKLSNSETYAIGIRGSAGPDSSAGAGSIAIGDATISRADGSIAVGTGVNIYAAGSYSVAVGNSSRTDGHSRAVALGNAANAAFDNSVAIGTNAKTTRVGEVNVGADTSGRGYNNTNYRVIGGVHDPIDAHDAATKGYVDSQGGGGGGDIVYSTKTTSNGADGGAVYIGGKNANQEIYPDPTTTDNHWHYFWALPFNTSETGYTYAPGSETINIGGTQSVGGEDNVTIGFRTKSLGSHNVNIGWQAGSTLANGSCVCVGDSTSCEQNYGVALGREAIVKQGHTGSVALGCYSNTTRKGEVYVGPSSSFAGFNSTNYRVIGGVHDGQTDHDVATVGQINATIDAINTALSTNIPHIGA